MYAYLLLLHYAHCNKQMTAASCVVPAGGAGACARHDYIILRYIDRYLDGYDTTLPLYMIPSSNQNATPKRSLHNVTMQKDTNEDVQEVMEN